MTPETAEEAIRKIIIGRPVDKDGNLLHTSRVFVAASVIQWIYENTKTDDQISHYLSQVEKHLNGELEMYWENGLIRIRKEKRGKL